MVSYMYQQSNIAIISLESESLNQFFLRMCSLISVVKPNTLYSVNIRKIIIPKKRDLITVNIASSILFSQFSND